MLWEILRWAGIVVGLTLFMLLVLGGVASWAMRDDARDWRKR